MFCLRSIADFDGCRSRVSVVGRVLGAIILVRAAPAKLASCPRRFTPQALQPYWHILLHQVIDFIDFFHKIGGK